MTEADVPRYVRKAPSLSPDCIWKPMTPDSPVPEDALFPNVKLNGDDVYIGRVEDGLCFYIGTAIPKKGVCFYLNKNLEVKSSKIYEILTVGLGFGDPLLFVDTKSNDKDMYDLFPAGLDEEDRVLYVGRYVDNNGDTFYGWMLKDLNKVFLPRDSTQGPSEMDKDFGVLMHMGIHMICRGCPTPLNPTGCD